jgi:hypothetical protein
MNRNFATFALIIWILAYIVSGSSEQVGAAKAELAGKIFIVFLGIWIPIFSIIVLQAIVEYGKKNSTTKPSFDWGSMR